MSPARPPAEKPEALRWQPLPADALWRMVLPLRTWFSPRWYGLEHIDPRRPTLFVGNRTIYGVFDLLLLVAGIYKLAGLPVRGLADPAHFGIPGWGELLTRLGAVPRSRENCDLLLDAGWSLLVFPGGTREIARRKGEAYKLVWKERVGFAHMAVKHGCSITPFASVGPEDAYSILVDADDVLHSPLGGLLKRSGIAQRLLADGDRLLPLARGLGLSAVPRPERFYFAFDRPIETARLRGREDDREALIELQTEVAAAVNRQIGRLQQVREQDQDKGLLRRVLTRYG